MAEKSKEGAAPPARQSVTEEESSLDQTSEAAPGDASPLDQTAGETDDGGSLLDQIIQKGKMHEKGKPHDKT